MSNTRYRRPNPGREQPKQVNNNETGNGIPLVYRNYRFLVEIDDFYLCAFSHVSGFSVDIDTVEYRWAEDPLSTVRTLPTLTRYHNITLDRGVMDAYVLYDWVLMVSSSDLAPPAADADKYRKNLTISFVSDNGEPGPGWYVMGAMPVSYQLGDLDAMNGGIAVETLELSCRSFVRFAPEAGTTLPRKGGARR